LAAQLGARDRQRVVLKNVWRKANKLPPLPVPEPRKIRPVPADRLRPLLDRYLAAAGDKRLAVRSEIESTGLGALPGVLDRRDRARKKSERAEWRELAKRLSCIVSEVKIGARSAKPDPPLVRRLESLKGKPFDARVFIRTVGSVLKKSANPRGIRVAAVRA